MERAIPVIPGDDVTVAREFYAGVLGFDIRFEATEDGRNGLIGFERGGICITVDCPMDGHGRNACVSLEVESADAWYAALRGRVELRRPPTDEPWGARTFGFHDPFGNTIFVMGPPTGG